MPKFNIERLQCHQNTTARIVARLQKSDQISPTLRKLYWLSVQHRISFKLLLLICKCTSQTAPECLSELVIPYKSIHELRSASDFPLDPTWSKDVAFGDRAFSIARHSVWNTIPPHIRRSSSVAIFKKSLKTYFFNQLRNPWEPCCGCQRCWTLDGL